ESFMSVVCRSDEFFWLLAPSLDPSHRSWFQMQYFKMYTVYSSNQPICLAALERYKTKNPQFAAFHDVRLNRVCSGNLVDNTVPFRNVLPIRDAVVSTCSVT